MGMIMAEARSLSVILDRIESVPNDFTIYVAAPSPLTSMTRAVAVAEPADGRAPSGMRYLLEASLAREAIKVWSEWRDGRIPSSEDRAEAVIYYAEHDAYMPAEQP